LRLLQLGFPVVVVSAAGVSSFLPSIPLMVIDIGLRFYQRTLD
jgi:hypothetical protein